MTHLIIDEKSKKGKTLLAYLKEIEKNEKYVHFLTDEEKEDIALCNAIDEGMKTKSVSKNEILKILKSKK